MYRSQRESGDGGGGGGGKAEKTAGTESAAAQITTLVHHMDDRPPATRQEFREMADLAAAVFAAGGGRHPSGGPPPAAAAAAAHDAWLLLGRIACNTFTVTDDDLRPVGIALYPAAASAGNHSCRPALCATFLGRTLRLRCIRPVVAGTELMLSYTDLARPRHVRQKELAAGYHFRCSCERCRRPPPEDAALDAFRCSDAACPGPVRRCRDRRHGHLASLCSGVTVDRGIGGGVGDGGVGNGSGNRGGGGDGGSCGNSGGFDDGFDVDGDGVGDAAVRWNGAGSIRRGVAIGSSEHYRRWAAMPDMSCGGAANDRGNDGNGTAGRGGGDGGSGAALENTSGATDHGNDKEIDDDYGSCSENDATETQDATSETFACMRCGRSLPPAAAATAAAAARRCGELQVAGEA
ncbi:unnamed protein product, partial [Phaeothamnion confervicola]